MPTIVAAAQLPRRAGRVQLVQTWIASPIQHGPVPRCIVVAPVKAPLRAAPQPVLGVPLLATLLPATPEMAEGDVMAVVVAALKANAAVVAAFGGTGKFGADAANFTATLPYGVYSETDETYQRVLGGVSIGHGTFELGVFDSTKQGARQKLDLVRRAINAIPEQVIASSYDRLFYIRAQDNSGRTIDQPAPGSGVTEYGRAMKFTYKVTRNDGFAI